MRRLPAFTLLELLVSSALFAVVVVVIVEVLASSAVIQDTGRQSQLMTSQMESISETLNTALSRSVPGQVTIYTDQSQNSYIVMSTLGTQSGAGVDGTAASAPHYEFYCINQNSLMQFVAPIGAVPNLSGFTANNVCTPAAVSGLLSLPTTSIASNILTDNTINFTDLWIQPLQMAALPIPLTTPQAYDFEIGGIYKQPGEARVDAQGSEPIILRGTAVVSDNPLVSNFSQ